MPHQRVTKEELQDCIDRGLSTKQIAKEIGFTPESARYHLAKNGLKTKWQVEPNKRLAAASGKKYAAESTRRKKIKLMEAHGNACIDCGYQGAPYQFDFDHRGDEPKEFNISKAPQRTFEEMLKESMKCDLVCSRCHRDRTHKRQCDGCEWCS